MSDCANVKKIETMKIDILAKTVVEKFSGGNDSISQKYMGLMLTFFLKFNSSVLEKNSVEMDTLTRSTCLFELVNQIRNAEIPDRYVAKVIASMIEFYSESIVFTFRDNFTRSIVVADIYNLFEKIKVEDVIEIDEVLQKRERERGDDKLALYAFHYDYKVGGRIKSCLVPVMAASSDEVREKAIYEIRVIYGHDSKRLINEKYYAT